MNKRRILVLTIFLLVVLASTATTTQRTVAADSIVQQTCAPYTGAGGWTSPATIPFANTNNWGLQNWNANNEPGQSCIYTYASGAYGWNFTKPNPSYYWLYPVETDWRPYGTPIAGLTSAVLDFSATTQYTSPASSTYADFSWDVWLMNNAGTITDEMMIWMIWGNPAHITNCSVFIFGCEWPAPFSFGTVNDGYNTYGLYEYENNVQQSLHVYEIQGQQIPTQINILPLIRYLQSLGRTPTEINSIDLGTEVYQGSGSVQVNSYSLKLGTASSTTTFAGPSSTTTSSSSPFSTSTSTQSTTSSTTTSSTLVSTSTTASSTSALVATSSSTQTTTSLTTTSSTSSLITTSSSTQTTTSSTASSATTSLTSTSQTTTTRVPTVSLNPVSTSAGSTVDVSGSGFSPSDTTCSISGSVVASPTCAVSGGTLTGAFTVANVAAGSYSVTATGTQAGDSASASFTVPSPSITISPTSAQIGASVGVTGSDFSKTDTGCSLSGIPGVTSTCSISSGTLSASFNVTSATPGTYTMTASGTPSGDFASATFIVKGASITFNPTSALAGSNVTVSGSGFSLSDTSCSLSGTALVTQSCSLSGGKLTGSFTVANLTAGGATAGFTITGTGNPAADSASATFFVTSIARTITVNPFSAPVGSTVQVDGSGFSASDSTCVLSGGSMASQTCSIADGSLTASFKVPDVAVGGYTVTVTGRPIGDSATADFTVTGSSLSVALNTTSAAAGTTVRVSGSGFLSSDSSCTLSGSVVSSPSCSIANGALSGSFIVANVPAGSYVVTAIGSPNEDVASVTFSVSVPFISQTTTTSTSSTVGLQDFWLKSSSNVILAQGGSGSATVIVGSLDGFSSSVALSASWVGTAPVGINLVITSLVTPMPNETGTALLTVTASPTASIGTFNIQVEGTSGSLTHILSPNIAVQILQTVTASSTSSTSSAASSSTSTVTTSMTTSTSNAPVNCPVSMATSGSALASSAEGLRSFRDQSIMKTRTGAAFMTVFNAWYYSFSPPLASYLGTHQTQRTAFGYALYPLIGLLYASYYTYMLISPLNSEVAAVTAGLVAAVIIGSVYLAPPLYLVKRTLRRKAYLSSKLSAKLFLASSAASCAAIGLSYAAGTGLVLGFATASLLLSILTLGVIAGIRLLDHVKLMYLTQELTALNEIFGKLTV